jgi:transposase
MGAAVAIRDDVPAEQLRRLARQESDGRMACRLLGLANVLDGMSRERAARQAGMDRQTLRDWVIRFNREGVEGLRDRPRSGRPSWLDEGQLAAFKALVLRGPDPERDGISTWRAKDLCRIVEQRFAVSYAENGMLRLLHDLDLSWQKTRPVHPAADAKAQARFKESFPALIAEIARDHPAAERLEVWFQDGRLAPRGDLGGRPGAPTGSARPAASAGAGSSAACARAACATCATMRSTCSARSARSAMPGAELRRHPRCLLRRLERAPRRNRPHPLLVFPRLGHTGQFLMGWY